LADTFGYRCASHMINAIDHLAHDLYNSESDREEFLRQLDLFGEVRGMELQMKRIDGSLVWIRLNGRALKILRVLPNLLLAPCTISAPTKLLSLRLSPLKINSVVSSKTR
ncbi:hypothetical protein ABMA58_20465, partial [Oceanospirillum sp. HFRX-1_2]